MLSLHEEINAFCVYNSLSLFDASESSRITNSQQGSVISSSSGTEAAEYTQTSSVKGSESTENIQPPLSQKEVVVLAVLRLTKKRVSSLKRKKKRKKERHTDRKRGRTEENKAYRQHERTGPPRLLRALQRSQWKL